MDRRFRGAACMPWTLGIESVNRCKDATFYSEIGTFGANLTRDAARTANACGVCDCKGEEFSSLSITSDWSRSGNQLTLGSISEDYCVEGDVLWIGGEDAYGKPKVSYKFSKHSCAGTPAICAQRTPEQCEVGGSCTLGHCKGKSSAQKGCEASTWQPECEVIEGCVWEAVGCYGEPNPECSFEVCDTEPGCS